MLTESVEALHERLREYIEATYHIATPGLLRQRRRLLDTAGVIRQSAYLESTKQYERAGTYDALFARLPPRARAAAPALAARLSTLDPPRLYDPPWEHQYLSAEALLGLRDDGRDSVVVFTGTGSGKTECFTLPILFRLLSEASETPQSFAVPAIRAVVLYPMNALVNDQLGRVRLLLGHDDVAYAFSAAAGRPARFGQYTGRTPFPGLRTFEGEGDGGRMKPFKSFYVDTVLGPILNQTEDTAQQAEDASLLLSALRDKGRWPAKPDLARWFGGTELGEAAQWRDRLHPMSDDRELIARHEFYGYTAPDGARYGAPPDVLITNYSMLEYMLMRPVERSIFDQTRAWLDAHPDEPFLLVLDEAHLYRGAQGTEVALLVRRLLERLGLSTGNGRRRVRIAITSASFSAAERATAFAAQLTGIASDRFLAIPGRLSVANAPAESSSALMSALADFDYRAFLGANGPEERLEFVTPVLRALGSDAAPIDAAQPLAIERALHAALVTHPVRQRLVDLTQVQAFTIPELAEQLFAPAARAESSRERAARATESLVSLCACARTRDDGASLLPSRIHTFHRGLPGLWVCLNPDCGGVRPDDRDGVAGALFGQPRERCPHCDSRVFALFTCRACGASYARAYTTDLTSPTFLWNSAADVTGVGADARQLLLPVDLLLEPARRNPEVSVPAQIDASTGVVLRVGNAGGRPRDVALYPLDLGRDGENPQQDGRVFYQCGVCADDNDRQAVGPDRRRFTLRQSPVEDHQTSGQEPFYALIHEQLLRQPPRPTPPAYLRRETALRGRKLLVFSDGRQKAARLATEVGRAALRDSVRPLLLRGYERLFQAGKRPALSASYAALLIGAVDAGVEIRATDESFDRQIAEHSRRAREVFESDFDDAYINALTAEQPPAVVATILLRVIRDKHTGLQALALARIAPSSATRLALNQTVARLRMGPLSEAEKRTLIELWLGLALEKSGCSLFAEELLERDDRWLWGREVGTYGTTFGRVLEGVAADALRVFREEWLPNLKRVFCDADGRLMSSMLTLSLAAQIGDLAGWQRCSRCSQVQGRVLRTPACVHCGAVGEMVPLEDQTALEQFVARKGFYRGRVGDGAAARQPIVAREHSAQLTGVSGDTHTRAERYELAFQDITAPTVDGMRSEIDILSCTTTMEVGIDIGTLSGVALRNMPPGRANYQQRAGRAGRRGSGVATVLAYADQDSHNQHFYENPQKLVKDPVPDPALNLSNRWIARRHLSAFALQQYLMAQIPAAADPTAADANLFGSLGTVSEFLGDGRITLSGFERWLAGPVASTTVLEGARRWLPAEIEGRDEMISSLPRWLPELIRRALQPEAGGVTAVDANGVSSDGDEDVAVEDSDISRSERLLDRLLYDGILPKYAFPTDLVAFRVFEATNGLGTASAGRKLRYSPQRSLALALSEYAPGKTVFIDGRSWVSGALYAPGAAALAEALSRTKSMRLCQTCGHTALFGRPEDGAASSCPSCGDAQFGAGNGVPWLRPPGFSHPVTRRPVADPSDGDVARAGRAILAAPSPAQDWVSVSPGIFAHLGRAEDREIIVTNHGPRDQGFRLCRTCGAIEPATVSRLANADGHRRPEPNVTGYSVACEAPDFEIVRLGTSFRTDVLVLRFVLPEPQLLDPRSATFRMAMASLTEALSIAVCTTLEIEPGEVLGGYRRGFTPAGPEPRALEVFLYDQLAGGAGFVVEASRRIPEILQAARAVLTHQATGQRRATPPCDRACYGCLLTFKNSYEHPLYDRWLGLDLLDAANTGVPATIEPARQQGAYASIRDWMRLFALGTVASEARVADAPDAPPAPIVITGGRRGGTIVPALAHPFSPSRPVDDVLNEILSNGAGLGVTVIPLDHLEVMRALPVAMERIREVLLG